MKTQSFTKTFFSCRLISFGNNGPSFRPNNMLLPSPWHYGNPSKHTSTHTGNPAEHTTAHTGKCATHSSALQPKYSHQSTTIKTTTSSSPSQKPTSAPPSSSPPATTTTTTTTTKSTPVTTAFHFSICQLSSRHAVPCPSEQLHLLNLHHRPRSIHSSKKTPTKNISRHSSGSRSSAKSQ